MASVTYNGVTGELSGKYSHTHSQKEFNFSGTILISGSSIRVEASILEDKLKEINKDFKLTQGGVTVIELKSSNGTGFLARPSLSKIPNELSSTRTREYNFSVTIQLPDTDNLLLREANFKVEYSPSRQKSITFYGEYTAGEFDDAIGVYLARFTAFIISILAKFPALRWKKTSEKLDVVRELTLLTASVVYVESLIEEFSSDTLDSLVDLNVEYFLQYQNETEGSPINYEKGSLGAVVGASGSASVDSEIGTGVYLNNLYTHRIRNLILGNLENMILSSGIRNYSDTRRYMVSDSHKVDPYSNKIFFEISFWVSTSGSAILMYKEEISIKTDSNEVYRKVWDGEDYSYSVYSPGKDKVINRTMSMATIQDTPLIPAPLTKDSLPNTVLKGEIRKISESEKRGRKYLGGSAPNEYKAVINFLAYSDQYKYMERIDEQEIF